MIKKFLSEFKDFAEKGSAIDMAVGIIVGSTMTALVNSLVKDVITPPIGLLAGKINFSEIVINLGGTAKLNIGLFINAIISFIITMFAIFILVRFINKLRSKKITTRTCPYCCMEKISVKATRCPYCCEPLKPVKEKVVDAELSLKKLIPIKKLNKEVKKLVKRK
jgi:large conductance mechanosensitive channel